MSNNGELKVRRLSDMVAQPRVEPTSVVKVEELERIGKTSVKSKNKGKQTGRTTTASGAVTTPKKANHHTQKEKQLVEKTGADNASVTAATPANRKSPRTVKKEPPASQLRIDQFFKRAIKSYQIPSEAKSALCILKAVTSKKSVQKRASARKSAATNGNGLTRRKTGRKRLFQDTSSETTETASSMSWRPQILPKQTAARKRKSNVQDRAMKANKMSPKVLTGCIDLCSDSEPEVEAPLVVGTEVNIKEPVAGTTANKDDRRISTDGSSSSMTLLNVHVIAVNDNVLAASNASNRVNTKLPSVRNEAKGSAGKSTLSETTQPKSIRLRSNLHLIEASKESIEYKKADRKSKSTCVSDSSNTMSFKAVGIKTNMARIAEEEEIDITAKNSAIKMFTSGTNVEHVAGKNCYLPTHDKSTFVWSYASSLCSIGETIDLTEEKPSTGVKTHISMHVEAKTQLDTITAVKNNSILRATSRCLLTELTSCTTNQIKQLRGKKTRVCPPYKVVVGTTFAVDAFQYGQIEGVTHYFLTHFHADHYIGLTRKFSMPLYLSPITARLVRAFIPVEEQYLHEIALNAPVVIDGVEVTAIDANHCPGAIMLLFKLPSGECILHTGDFRASADMESEPIFWNHNIHTLYLDTTYISNKYAFCTQSESIDRGKKLVRDFRLKHELKRILIVCGSYLIGKEKFWCEIADKFNLKVWTDANRMKALKAITSGELEEHDIFEGLNGRLCDDPYAANMHVISMIKLSYMSLVEYLKTYSSHFDLLLAIRPSGWEKNSRPQYRGQVNIVGVEYSEHSSYSELERFVTFLKPTEVISTVPIDRNPLICGQVPQKWYKYKALTRPKRNFQTSITSYIKFNSLNNKIQTKEATDRVAHSNQPYWDATSATNGLEMSPFKSTPCAVAGSPPPDKSGNEENITPIQKSGTKGLALKVKPTDHEMVHLATKMFAITPPKSVCYDLDVDADDDWLS